MLGRLLQYEINEEKVTDVHDRALLYYRLLVKGVPEVRDTACLCCPLRHPNRFSLLQAKKVLSVPKNIAVMAEQDLTPEQRDSVFQEFNSLSVIYGRTAETFIVQEPPYAKVPHAAAGNMYGIFFVTSSAQTIIFFPRISPNFRDDENEMVGDVLQPTYSSAHDEGHDDGGLLASITTSSAAAPVFRLVEGPKVAAKVFQQYWGSFQTA